MILNIILIIVILFQFAAIGRLFWLYEGAMKRTEGIFKAWKGLEEENKILNEVLEEIKE